MIKPPYLVAFNIYFSEVTLWEESELLLLKSPSQCEILSFLIITLVKTYLGGPNALIDTATSAQGLYEVIEQSSPNNSGEFINYDGSRIAW